MSNDYDWAAAALELFQSKTEDIRKLVGAAGLDAQKGDLADVDFNYIDLTNQDLSGWDLRFACLQNAKISNANMIGCKLDPEALITATNWHEAKLDPEVRTLAEKAELHAVSLSNLDLPKEIVLLLREAGYKSLGEIIEGGPGPILRIQRLGRVKFDMLRNSIREYALIQASSRLDAYEVQFGTVSSNNLHYRFNNTNELAPSMSRKKQIDKSVVIAKMRITFSLKDDVADENIFNAINKYALKFSS